MDLVEIWRSHQKATKKELETAERIVRDYTKKGVTAEIRWEKTRATVWRDRGYEKRLIDDYVIGL